VILVDTGPLVAAALSGDNRHVQCVELFTSLHLNDERLLVPSFVVTEVCFMLERDGGPRLEAEFVRSLAAGDFTLVEADAAALDRAADLIATYADLPLGVVDATVVALAEHLGVTEIAALDRRHFTVVRPKHVSAFSLLP